MNPDELFEAIVQTTGARSAIAALIISEDHAGARQRAEQMSRGDLLSLVLLSAHEYVGGYLNALEKELERHGKGQEQAQREAREMALLHFRATAQMWAGLGGQSGASGAE